jgi:hypothetical protein
MNFQALHDTNTMITDNPEGTLIFVTLHNSYLANSKWKA